MLEIALHNPRQHRQFHHAGGPLTLARADSDPALWVAVDPDARRAGRRTLGNHFQRRGHRARSHRLQNRVARRVRARMDRREAPAVPAQFVIGDTRFEISESTAEQFRSRRPLEKLHRDAHGRSESKSVSIPGQATSGPSPTTLTKWFAALGTLNRWTTSLQELYVQAARAAVDAIGLDGAIISAAATTNGKSPPATCRIPNSESTATPPLSINCSRSPETLFQAAPKTTPQSETPQLRQSTRRSHRRHLSHPQRRRHARRRRLRLPLGPRRQQPPRHSLSRSAPHRAPGQCRQRRHRRLEHEAESERRRVLLEQLAAGANDRNQHGHTTRTARSHSAVRRPPRLHRAFGLARHGSDL